MAHAKSDENLPLCICTLRARSFLAKLCFVLFAEKLLKIRNSGKTRHGKHLDSGKGRRVFVPSRPLKGVVLGSLGSSELCLSFDIENWKGFTLKNALDGFGKGFDCYSS
jgi:hypothetical protein